MKNKRILILLFFVIVVIINGFIYKNKVVTMDIWSGTIGLLIILTYTVRAEGFS